MKKITEYFRNAKLNIKFTIIILLFTVVPLCISIGALFHIMMQNVIDENISYMQYTMERNSDNPLPGRSCSGNIKKSHKEKCYGKKERIRGAERAS